MNKISAKLTTLGLVILLAGCDVDGKATMSGYAFGSYVSFVCDRAKFDQEQYDRFFYDLPDDKRIPIESQLQNTKSECAALSPIWDEVAASHEKLDNGVYLPDKVYLFMLDVGEDDSLPIGYFDSLPSCSDAKKKLEEGGYRAGDCYKRVLFLKYAWS